MQTAAAPASHTAVSFDGSHISFRDFGGLGPVLILLPGWACVQTIWDNAVSQLQMFRVVSLDFAGFGLSTAGQREWTIENFARDVRAVLHALDLSDVTLIGHSMGGAVALEAAYLQSERVARVIGCDSFTYAEFYERFDERLMDDVLASYRSDYIGTVRGMIVGYMLQRGDPALASHVSDMMAGARPEYALPAMEHFLRWDVTASLQRCPVPVFTVNARPFLKPEAQRRYENRIQISTIDGVGHFLMMEQPAAFANAVTDILQRDRA